jgi:hypothetical protein
MRVQEIWKFIHPRVSYHNRVLSSGNMILVNFCSIRLLVIHFLYSEFNSSSCCLLHWFYIFVFVNKTFQKGTCISWWWGKYENLFTQEYHIPWRQHPIMIWYSLQAVTMLLWMWLLNVWDNVPMDLKYVCQQYFTCMCFLDFMVKWGHFFHFEISVFHENLYNI